MRHPRRFGALGLVLAVLGGSLALAACAPDKATCTDGSQPVTTLPSSYTNDLIDTANRTWKGDGASTSTFSDDTAFTLDTLMQNQGTATAHLCLIGGKFTGAGNGLHLSDQSGAGMTANVVHIDVTNGQISSEIDSTAIEGSYANATGWPVYINPSPAGRMDDLRLDGNQFVGGSNFPGGTCSYEILPLGYRTSSTGSNRSNPLSQVSANLIEWKATYCAPLTDHTNGAAMPQPLAFTTNTLVVSVDGTAANDTATGTIAGFPTPNGLNMTTSSCKDNKLVSRTVAIPTAVKNAWNAMCANTTFVDPAGATAALTNARNAWASTYGTP